MIWKNGKILGCGVGIFEDMMMNVIYLNLIMIILLIIKQNYMLLLKPKIMIPTLTKDKKHKLYIFTDSIYSLKSFTS